MTKSFTPPKRLLMGPGPSDIPDRVLQAMARPTIGHLDPKFVEMMDDVKRLLQYAMQTENSMTIPISAPGSAGMEACFVNLLEPGDKAIICRNGVFGERMRQNAERCGAQPVIVDDPWGAPVSPDKLKETLSKHSDAKLVAFVHAETSTGALSDAKELTKIAHQHDCLALVDAVTSLGGVPLRVDEWEIDALYSGSQKCLSAPPGLAPLTFSARAMQVVANRKSPVQSWFLDLNLLTGYWGDGGGNGKRAYHHTAPIHSLYALHESLVLLEEEGLDAAWARHQKHHQTLVAGLQVLGMEMIVEPAYRLPQLNSVYLPDGVNDGTVRKRLLDEYNLEIGAGLGDLAGKAWRIGLMGASCDRMHVEYCLKALGEVLGTTDKTSP